MIVYTLQINYKSGNSVQADFTEFTIRGKDYSWVAHGDSRPMFLGVDNIESVWTISTREIKE